MPDNLEIKKAMMLAEFRIPSITAYNRLEISPRTRNFQRSLKAEVRDPLWMLTRQWQFGEFQGEDAASPVTSQILGEHYQIDRVSFPQDRRFLYDESIPLEAKVEREKIPANLFLRAQMGRYYMKLLKPAALSQAARFEILSRYKLQENIDERDTDAFYINDLVKDTIPDGYKVYEDIISGGYGPWASSQPNAANLIDAADDLTSWFVRTYSQPDSPDDSAWLPSQLEYQFALGTPRPENQQKTLVAEQYFEGHLDWYSFDLDNYKSILMDGVNPDLPYKTDNLVSFIPSPVAFKGMPHPRFWQMEESQTDFGKIDTSTTGLLHLLFAEFGLIYSNDWFMLPYPMDINTMCEVKGIVITDVFGQHVLVRPAGEGAEHDWKRWTMFHLTERNGKGRNNLFYLPPAVTKLLESEPIEKVNFLRDEMANMVWAVENTVPSQWGKGIPGNELAIDDTPPTPFVPVGEANIRYVLGTTVPENWIPFIPVHLPGSVSEIQLQRAQMPAAKRPKGILLTEKAAPYFINEEEVPRAGIHVKRNYHRTRWTNGATFLWLGRRKTAGKGEGWSNLKFDQLEDIKGNKVVE
ncbi:hypothetical protein BH23BAC1_BH23BAC1_26960 [soil metagenome]